MKQRLSALLLLALFCTACSVRPVEPPPPPSDDATIKLTEAAHSISESLIELARIEKLAIKPVNGKKLADPADFAIHGVASIDWSGPIAPLLQRLAVSSHYKMRVVGKAPAIPIIITVSAKDAPLANLIQDVDFQAGTKADVVVYPRNRVIELRYAQGLGTIHGHM